MDLMQLRAALPAPRASSNPFLCPSPAFTPFPAPDIEQAISQRFEQQVERYPLRLAIKTRRRSLTYDTLNRHANRVARSILAERPDRQQPVALLMEKDIGYFAAILGVLKAGDIYVPLAPTYPQARNALLIEDSGAAIILTDDANLNSARQLAATSSAIVINYDQLEPGLDDTNPAVAIAPTDYAYILYTSGTTGRPKGVVESHRNLLHNMLNYTNDHFLSCEDRLICLGSCAFSNILKDIFGAFLNGASLFPVDIQSDGLAGLGDWVRDQGITVYNSVPTVFRHFLSTLPANAVLSSVRFVRLGGEPVIRKDLDLLRRHFPANCVLVNGYGATETGTATMCVLDRDTEVTGSVVPIGRAARGMEVVLLLDDDGTPVADGDIGQIAVRSEYLACGYWKRPDLTAAAFRPDPDGSSKRMYMTGDLARRLPDGRLVSAGRKDSQVKVRGHRIELGEIEGKLLEFPSVKEAVVTARAELRRDNQLVAYVVPHAGTEVNTLVEQLRRHLKEHLPPYAVPSALVVLAALPLSPNGKLDPKALPAPAAQGTARTQAVPPRNEVQKRLVQIWQDVLEMPAIGISENFFDAGGDSLAAAHLFIRIEEVFGKVLPLDTLFRSGTIEQLAAIIEESTQPKKRQSLIALQPQGDRPRFFCVHAIGGEVFSYRDLARLLGDDQPFYAFQGFTDPEAARDVCRIEETAARYVEELLAFQPTGPYCLGGYSYGAVVAYEMAQQLRRGGHEVAMLAVIDQRRPNLIPGAKWTSSSIAACLRNLPHWVRDDILQCGAANLKRRVGLKVAALKKRSLGFLAPAARSRREPELGDFYDLSRVPSHYQVLMRSHFRALRNYVPQVYPGTMCLFRARTQPLAPGDWHRRDMGWGGLPAGGLTVTDIPGNHETLLDEPHVHILARKLRAALTAARTRA